MSHVGVSMPCMGISFKHLFVRMSFPSSKHEPPIQFLSLDCEGLLPVHVLIEQEWERWVISMLEEPHAEFNLEAELEALVQQDEQQRRDENDENPDAGTDENADDGDGQNPEDGGNV